MKVLSIVGARPQFIIRTEPFDKLRTSSVQATELRTRLRTPLQQGTHSLEEIEEELYGDRRESAL